MINSSSGWKQASLKWWLPWKILIEHMRTFQNFAKIWSKHSGKFGQHFGKFINTHLLGVTAFELVMILKSESKLKINLKSFDNLNGKFAIFSESFRFYRICIESVEKNLEMHSPMYLLKSRQKIKGKSANFWTFPLNPCHVFKVLYTVSRALIQ